MREIISVRYRLQFISAVFKYIASAPGDTFSKRGLVGAVILWLIETCVGICCHWYAEYVFEL